MIRSMRAFTAATIAAAAGALACADQTPFAPETRVSRDTESTVSADALPAPSGAAVVVFVEESGLPDEGLALIVSLGGTITSELPQIGVVFATGLTGAALDVLRGSGLVLDAGPDYVLDWLPGVRAGPVVEEPDAAPNDHDPSAASRFDTWQWGPQQIQADRAWAAGYTGDPAVTVAILDTGVDYDHRELRGLVDLSRSKSFVPSDPVPPGDHEVMDLHYHGSHVASTVVTRSVTIAGVAPHTTLIGVKVLSWEGSGTFEGVINGIVYAADQDADVINMSLGAEFDRNLEGAPALIRATRRGIQYAEKQGTLVVSAAGNSAIDLDGSGTLVAMPCEVSTMCISATGPLLQQNHDQPAWYTNFGSSAIEVAAPGGNYNPDDPDREQGTWQQEDLVAGACSRRSLQVPQCAVNNDFVAFYLFAAGTSMATPHVSGAAAVAVAKNGRGTLSASQLANLLEGTADDVNEPGNDAYSGSGRVNVYRAVTN